MATHSVAMSENRAPISTISDKLPKDRRDPSQRSLQRWATECGAEKGVHQKSSGTARAKKKQPATVAKKNSGADAVSESTDARRRSPLSDSLQKNESTPAPASPQEKSPVIWFASAGLTGHSFVAMTAHRPKAK
jgi:hypothetical protein